MNSAEIIIILGKFILHIMFVNFDDKFFDNFGEKWKLLDNKMKERKIIHISKSQEKWRQ
jgi:hypothetical protein